MQRLPSLDGLRAFSIALVLAGHFYFFLAPSAPKSLFWDIVANHSLGVSIFFVISGFLITLLLRREAASTKGISLSAFYVRRAFRIWPAYYFFLGSLWILHSLDVLNIPFPDFAAAFFFVWNYLPSGSSWWVGHTWSLAVEEQFYLLWPLVLALTGALASRRVAIAGLALTPCLRIGTYLLVPALRPRLDWLAHSRMDALMAGSALALLWEEKRLRELLAKPWSAKAAFFCALFALVFSPGMESLWGSYYRHTVGLTLESLAIASMLAWLVQNPRSLPGSFLNSRPSVYWGTLSYSLYLWQQVFLNPDRPLLPHWSLSLAALYVVSEISYRCIELPSLKLRDVLLSKDSANSPSWNMFRFRKSTG